MCTPTPIGINLYQQTDKPYSRCCKDAVLAQNGKRDGEAWHAFIHRLERACFADRALHIDKEGGSCELGLKTRPMR